MLLQLLVYNHSTIQFNTDFNIQPFDGAKTLSTGLMCMERRLLSLTKCHGVPCSLPSRITTKVVKKTARLLLQDQDQMCKTKTSWFKTAFLSSRRLETNLHDYTGNDPSLRVILPDLVDLGQTVRDNYWNALEIFHPFASRLSGSLTVTLEPTRNRLSITSY